MTTTDTVADRRAAGAGSSVTDQQRVRFTRDEVPRLLAMFGFIAALHAIGWGLFTHYNGIARIHGIVGSNGKLVYAGAGALAYTFGLRHAFDADHISAIDNTTRELMSEGQRPMGVGFFFSLGHSSVVFALSVLINVGVKTLNSRSGTTAPRCTTTPG